MKVALASKSEIRKKLLNSAGLVFECMESDVDESVYVDLDPKKRALDRAKAKASSVARIWQQNYKDQNFVVIGADQVLWMDGIFFSKARSKEDAFLNLSRLQNKTHILQTACYIHFKNAHTSEMQSYQHVARTEMTMRALDSEQIRRYIETGEGVKSVGCYEFENLGIGLFRNIQGDALSIPGIPTMWLLEQLIQIGVKPSWML